MIPTAVRKYTPYDEDAVIEMWQRTWQVTRPGIDFAERVPWFREHLRDKWAPLGHVYVAEQRGRVVGLAVLKPAQNCLEQFAVAPSAQGTGAAELLMSVVKDASPETLELTVNSDNFRAIRFYEKHGFEIVSEGANVFSGLPILLMRWVRDMAKNRA